MYDNQMQALLAYAYIAGLIDGEGTFMITRSRTGWGKHIRKTPSYCPRIKIGMTEEAPLKFTHQYLGIGTLSYEGTRPSRPTRKGMFTWQVLSAPNCIKVINMIEDFLVLKKPHAEHLKYFCKTFKRTSKCMDGVPKDELSFREDAYEKMRKLNGKRAAATTKPYSIRENETIV
jgi:LAGLIDADG endonuclease